MYNYEVQKQIVFTDEGQRMLLKVRDNMYKHCRDSGAVGFWQAVDGITGDSWDMLACVDRLIELGEFECIYDKGRSQDRIYKVK